MTLTKKQRDLLMLISRSPKLHKDWRQVSDGLWDALLSQFNELMDYELIEIDITDKQVRLTTDGQTVVRFL